MNKYYSRWRGVFYKTVESSISELGFEEKWSMLDVKPLQFPKMTVYSVKRATLTQHFEADFIRAMGMISPSAALYAKAVIAGVQRDLPVCRRW